MKNIIKWICGVILIVAGIGTLLSSILAGVIYLFVGLFLLPPVLSATQKKLNTNISTAGKWIIVLVGITIAPLLSGGFSTANTVSSAPNENIAALAETESTIGVGETLHTEYFDVIVNKVTVSENIRTGNQFANLPAEPGVLYLVLNTTYKNTDSESRMIDDGAVFVNYNGKEYEFDKAETILLEGWGILLDQINPLTIKTTNVVYKIPAEIKGPAYYEPGRNYDSKRIYLGEFK